MAATDRERELTDRGRQHVRLVAERFVTRNELGALKVFASPLVRAQQTAEIWMDVLGMQSAFEVDPDISPEGNVVSFSRRLSEQQGAWLVVSHFPFVPFLASFLLTGQKERARIATPTGTIISLAPDAEPGRPGTYRLASVDN